MAAQDMLLHTLVELADTLVDDFDVIDLLTRLVERCIEAFNVSDAGLLIAAPVGSELRVMAASSNAMRNTEFYELQSQQGPCIDCYHTGVPVLNQALDGETPWPRFTPVALRYGFRSVTALPLRLRRTTIGALNLFRTDTSVMDADQLAAAQAFADVATIAILQHQVSDEARVVNEQLQHALTSRVVIEQAKGMLAERADISVDAAFDRLRQHARTTNQRLGHVAQRFIDGDIAHHQLTPPPRART